ncbi:MAG: 4'-phosphopantetheinyl transferase superfamily protein [Oscillospiraceae bacterium]|nr:4'-phosphopantetheinyl transferase superfamily protein [Oscillospiraceae bacterium]
MKIYVCEDTRTARWRKYILNDKKISLAFAKKCICNFIGERERDIEIVFSKNEYGKPFIDGIYKTGENKRDKMDISVFFSLSHSGHMLVCAVACFNIGADCQKKNVENTDNLKKIAARFFSVQENKFLDSLVSSDKESEERESEYINNFFKIWTKKEAYIKYTGKGLSEGMKTFSVTSDTKQKNYCKEVYFKRVKPKARTPENSFYIYLCYNKANKNIWQVKYF